MCTRIFGIVFFGLIYTSVLAEDINKALEKDVGFWAALHPFGSENSNPEGALDQAFYEFSTFFNAMDAWRDDIYRPFDQQPLWRQLRDDVVNEDRDDFLLLHSDYCLESATLDSCQIKFEGRWTSTTPEKTGFRFAITPQLETIHAKQNKPARQLLGETDGKLLIQAGILTNDSVKLDFSSQIFLDTLLFREFLSSIEAINTLLDRHHLPDKKLPENPTRKSDTQLGSQYNFSAFEKRLYAQFVYSLPNIMATFERFSEFEQLGTATEMLDAQSVTRIDHKQALNLDALKEHYPDTYRDFKTLLTSLSFQSVVRTHEGAQIGSFSYNSDTNQLAAKLALVNGGFALQAPTGKLTGALIYPSELTHLDYQITTHAQLSLFGLDVSIRNMNVKARYDGALKNSEKNRHASLKMALSQKPDIDVSGTLFYVLPKWLIDLLIPGTLETQIADAFDDVIAGNNGKGISVDFSFHEEAGKHTLALNASAELPYDLFSALLKIEDQEARSKPRLYETLRQNLRDDFAVFSKQFNKTSVQP